MDIRNSDAERKQRAEESNAIKNVRITIPITVQYLEPALRELMLLSDDQILSEERLIVRLPSFSRSTHKDFPGDNENNFLKAN